MPAIMVNAKRFTKYGGFERPNTSDGTAKTREVYMFGTFEMPGLYYSPDGGGSGGAPTGNAPGSPTGTEGGEGGAPAGSMPAGEGGITFTPEQQRHVDELIKTRLERERTKIKGETETAQQRAQEEAERKRLEEQAQWETLAKKQEGELSQLKAQLAAMELAALRREVAEAAGLSEELAQRLQGTTREELEADAVALAKLVPPDPRHAIAAEVGLPAELALRIAQGTREKMLADARALLQYIKPATPGSPPARERAGTARGDEIDSEREKALRQKYRIRN